MVKIKKSYCLLRDFFKKWWEEKFNPLLENGMRVISLCNIQRSKRIHIGLSIYFAIILSLIFLGNMKITFAISIILLFLNLGFMTMVIYSTIYTTKYKSEVFRNIEARIDRLKDLDLTSEGLPESLDELEKDIEIIAESIKGILKKSFIKIKKSTGISADLDLLIDDTNTSLSKVIEGISKLADETNTHAKTVEELSDYNKKIVEKLEFINDLNQRNFNNSEASVNFVMQGEIAIDEQDVLMKKNISLSNEISNDIYSLNDQIKSIETMSNSITSLAREINFVAINAAIEASKVEGNNRSISIIATEIKKLSVSTSDLAKKILSITTTIKASSDKTVDSINTFSESLERQKESLVFSLTTFGSIKKSATDISENVKKSSEFVSETTEMSRKISDEANKISMIASGMAKNTEQLSGSAQSQTASVGLIAFNFKKLKGLVEEIKSLLEKVKIK